MRVLLIVYFLFTFTSYSQDNNETQIDVGVYGLAFKWSEYDALNLSAGVVGDYHFKQRKSLALSCAFDYYNSGLTLHQPRHFISVTGGFSWKIGKKKTVFRPSVQLGYLSVIRKPTLAYPENKIDYDGAYLRGSLELTRTFGKVKVGGIIHGGYSYGQGFDYFSNAYTAAQAVNLGGGILLKYSLK